MYRSLRLPYHALLSLLIGLGSLLPGQGWAQGETLAYAEPAVEVEDSLRKKLIENIEAADSFDDHYHAEAWLLLMSGRMERYVKDPDHRLRLLRKIHSAARQTELQPELVLAVIEVESHFNHYAVSPVGAQGIMQVMPFWKNEIGRPEDNLIDLDTNLRYGCTILKHYLERSDGRLAEALARYNGSYGSYRYAAKVMDAWERWR
ncbi:lytic transglycosylase domain-containing protein [Marinimicrobium locisalis]|uniref:lytic transglycosylase domain-containing protein n=1 Tax=Marinimicrobium locisalis TaxID=546022 RepID=UPI003D300E47